MLAAENDARRARGTDDGGGGGAPILLVLLGAGGLVLAAEKLMVVVDDVPLVDGRLGWWLAIISSAEASNDRRVDGSWRDG
jgi:hypothetical protein